MRRNLAARMSAAPSSGIGPSAGRSRQRWPFLLVLVLLVATALFEGGGNGSVRLSSPNALGLSRDPCRFPGQWSTWDPLVRTKYTIDPRWISAIRADPSRFRALAGAPGTAATQCLRAARSYIRSRGGSSWNGITDEGLRLVIATAFAFESVPYGASTSFPDSLGGLLNSPALDCSEYVALVMRAYHSTLPLEAESNLRLPHLLVLGWRSDPTVPNTMGNHAELVSYDTGVNLWLDPTAGMVAPFDLGRALGGDRIEARDALILDRTRVPPNIRALREALTRNLSAPSPPRFAEGGYLMYVARPALPIGRTPTLAELSNGTEDWVESVATNGTVHYYLTNGHRLFRVDAGGAQPVAEAIQSISSGPRMGTVFALNESGDLLRFGPDTGEEALVLHGVAQLEAVSDGEVAALLRDGSLLSSEDGKSFGLVGHEVAAIALGKGTRGLYSLRRDGSLVLQKGEAFVPIADHIKGLTSLRNGAFIAYWSQDGDLSIGTSAGEVKGPIVRDVAEVIRGPGQWTLDILTNSGEVCRTDLDPSTGQIVPLDAINLDDHFSYCGSPPVASDSAFRSISLRYSDTILEGVRTDGTHVLGQAASY